MTSGIPKRRPGGGGGAAAAGARLDAAVAAVRGRRADAGQAGAAAPAAGRWRGPTAAVPPPPVEFSRTAPSRITVGKVLGLRQAWYVYRGAGKVTSIRGR